MHIWNTPTLKRRISSYYRKGKLSSHSRDDKYYKIGDPKVEKVKTRFTDVFHERKSVASYTALYKLSGFEMHVRNWKYWEQIIQGLIPRGQENFAWNSMFKTSYVDIQSTSEEVKYVSLRRILHCGPLDRYPGPITWNSFSAIHCSTDILRGIASSWGWNGNNFTQLQEQVNGKTHQAAEEPHIEDLEKNVLDGPALRVSYRIVDGLVPEKSSEVQGSFQVQFKPCSLDNMSWLRLVGFGSTLTCQARSHTGWVWMPCSIGRRRWAKSCRQSCRTPTLRTNGLI